MPELPEVQTVVADLISADLIGCQISRAGVYHNKIIAQPSPASFKRHLKGAIIQQIGRRGKYIVIDLSGWNHLLVHLRMTGHLYLENDTHKRTPHDHVILYLDDGRILRYHDPRKFGRFFLLDDPKTILGKLGPEPLADQFTARRLEKIIAHRKRMLKPMLLDQTIIAGLGNIYVDEALWRARLNPIQRAATLTAEEMRRLHRAIRFVLRSGIKNRGTSLGKGETGFNSATGKRGLNRHNLNVFRRIGAPCPRCRSLIQRIVVGQRSTFICERCQPLPAGSHHGRVAQQTTPQG